MIGICFHVGSGCSDINAYTEAIQHTRNLFDFAKTVGFDFNLVDIGGGFPGYEGDGITPMDQVTSQTEFEIKIIRLKGLNSHIV